MNEFSELVKRFDRIRSYVRDFYIYGFKTREEYTEGSGRTYDNERRRIESWFYDYVNIEYGTDKKKTVAIAIDSSLMEQNPLFAAWKSKSFTSNDIMLHFFIPDFLSRETMCSVDEVTDGICEQYGVVFDAQTVRNKLAEYMRLGLLDLKKSRRLNLYGIRQDIKNLELAMGRELCESGAVAFFQGAAPFGFIGSTLFDHWDSDNTVFRMKHNFLVHTLEDEILLLLLKAMHCHKNVSLENKSAKTGRIRIIDGTPLTIMASAQTGRRYVCVRTKRTYNSESGQAGPKNCYSQRYQPLRLDCIRSVAELDEQDDYERQRAALVKNANHCWGVGFGQNRGLETISFCIQAEETHEDYILQRLEREKRSGRITRVKRGIYRFEGSFYDSNELLPWIRTFIGRITSFTCTNKTVVQKFYQDMERMAHLYDDDTP